MYHHQITFIRMAQIPWFWHLVRKPYRPVKEELKTEVMTEKHSSSNTRQATKMVLELSWVPYTKYHLHHRTLAETGSLQKSYCLCVCVCVFFFFFSKPKGGHFVAVEVIVLVMLCVSVGDSVPPCIVLCLIHHLYYVMPSLLKQHLKRLQNIVAGIFLGGIMWWRGISWVEMHDNQRKELLSDPECRHHVSHATRNPPGNWPRKNTNQQEQRWWHAIANPHTSTRKQSWKMPKSSTRTQ